MKRAVFQITRQQILLARGSSEFYDYFGNIKGTIRQNGALID